MTREMTLKLRVRYSETDAMGFLHHSRVFQYFEIGRVEMLRAAGIRYADLERSGVFFVVVKAECQFKSPARNDDEVTLITRIEKQTHVRIDHSYRLMRDTTILAVGKTTIACVDREGKLQQIPEELGEPD